MSSNDKCSGSIWNVDLGLFYGVAGLATNYPANASLISSSNVIMLMLILYIFINICKHFRFIDLGLKVAATCET